MNKPITPYPEPINNIIIDSHGYLLTKCPECRRIYRHDDDHAKTQQQLNALRVFYYAVKQALRVLEGRLQPATNSWADAIDAINAMERDNE